MGRKTLPELEAAHGGSGIHLRPCNSPSPSLFSIQVDSREAKMQLYLSALSGEGEEARIKQ